jgi:hypothetical protein
MPCHTQNTPDQAKRKDHGQNVKDDQRCLVLHPVSRLSLPWCPEKAKEQVQKGEKANLEQFSWNNYFFQKVQRGLVSQ